MDIAALSRHKKLNIVWVTAAFWIVACFFLTDLRFPETQYMYFNGKLHTPPLRMKILNSQQIMRK